MQSPQGVHRPRLPAGHVHQPQEAGAQVSDRSQQPRRGCLAPLHNRHLLLENTSLVVEWLRTRAHDQIVSEGQDTQDYWFGWSWFRVCGIKEDDFPSGVLMVTSQQGAVWAGRHSLRKKMKEPERKRIPTWRDVLVSEDRGDDTCESADLRVPRACSKSWGWMPPSHLFLAADWRCEFLVTGRLHRKVWVPSALWQLALHK